jgi:hypothetical protein
MSGIAAPAAAFGSGFTSLRGELMAGTLNVVGAEVCPARPELVTPAGTPVIVLLAPAGGICVSSRMLGATAPVGELVVVPMALVFVVVTALSTVGTAEPGTMGAPPVGAVGLPGFTVVVVPGASGVCCPLVAGAVFVVALGAVPVVAVPPELPLLVCARHAPATARIKIRTKQWRCIGFSLAPGD